MRIIKDIRELKNLKITFVSIGSFDGLHLGHRAILKELTALPNSLLITFYPHPRIIIAPAEKLNVILTKDEKIKILDHFFTQGHLTLIAQLMIYRY